MQSAGIFGPKLSGKTTLARELSKRYWRDARMRSFVLDPHLEDWGKQALVFGDEDPDRMAEQERLFWATVWRTEAALVIVEEASTTIRRERELIPVFTRLRHRRHKLIVIGHSGIDLLPTMRQQLDTIYLFRQPEEAAVIWSRTFCDKRLLAAEELAQFEFLEMRLYGTPSKRKLQLSHGTTSQAA